MFPWDSTSPLKILALVPLHMEPSKNVMRSFVPSSSWEFYIFTQLDRARWLSNGYGEADSRLFKLLRYLKVATVIYKWCVLEH